MVSCAANKPAPQNSNRLTPISHASKPSNGICQMAVRQDTAKPDKNAKPDTSAMPCRSVSSPGWFGLSGKGKRIKHTSSRLRIDMTQLHGPQLKMKGPPGTGRAQYRAAHG